MAERLVERKEWQGYAKNNDGEIVTVDLVSNTFQPEPEAVDIESMLVNRAAPTIIRPTRRKRPTRGDTRTLVAGDAQIPYHDERAVELFQRAVVESQPDNIVFVGDMIDLPGQSKYQQHPEWAQTTQSSIDTYHTMLAQTRANAPNSQIYVVHGNHEKRLDDYVRRNAAEVLGLRRANMANELAVLTLQYLVRYEDLEVQSIDGYPNGTLWLEDNLKFVHGTNTKSGGSNAARYLATENETTVYGHSHRAELAFRTWATRLGSKVVAAASPGALCLVDGSVPGVHRSMTAQGEVVKKAENWQQGILLIDHNERAHDIVPSIITERGIIIDGKRYE